MALDFTPASGHTVDYGDVSAYDDWGTNKLSIAVRVWNDDWTAVAGLVNKRDAFDSNNAYSIGMNYTGADRIDFEIGTGSGSGCRYYLSTAGFTPSVWTSFVAIYDGDLSAGSRIAIYQDGVAAALTVIVEGTSAIVTTAASLVLGRVNSGSLYFDGRMAETGLWKVALTANEAIALSKPPGCSPLLVRPTSLVFYDGLVRQTGDRVQGTAGTTSAVVADHPRVIYPSRRRSAPFTHAQDLSPPLAALVMAGVAASMRYQINMPDEP